MFIKAIDSDNKLIEAYIGAAITYLELGYLDEAQEITQCIP